MIESYIIRFCQSKGCIVTRNMNQLHYQEILIKQYLKCVAAVNPAKLISENLKIEKGSLNVCNKVYDITDKNIFLVGFGKAVLGMASQCEKILGEHLKKGVICGPSNIQDTFKSSSDYNLKKNSVIEVHEGARNNLPDKNAEIGADAIIELVQRLDCNKDHLIILISGGGSALFPKPKPGISLAEKLETINLLMKSGADISELNTVRKKLSLVKGGGLASLIHPVKSICLIISDVINDPLDIIASGPTVPNLDCPLAAFNILKKYNLESKVSSNILKEIKDSSLEKNNTVMNKFAHVDNFIIGNNQKALDAAKMFAQESGFETIILSSQIRGTVQNVANFYVNTIFEMLNAIHTGGLIQKDSLLKDCCFDIENKVLDKINKTVELKPKTINVIWGGETTVKVTGKGKGGRNQELALIISILLHNLKLKHSHLFNKYEVQYLCAGTDGIDGPTEAAGVVGDLYVVEKARKLNLKIEDYVSQNDSYNFFCRVDNGSYLIKTGHSGTNVMDVHIFIIYEK